MSEHPCYRHGDPAACSQTAPAPVTHDLTPADVEAGTWVRMVSTWPDGATVEHYGPVTNMSESRDWYAVRGAVVPGTDPLVPRATLTHFSRVDPPAPPRPTPADQRERYAATRFSDTYDDQPTPAAPEGQVEAQPVAWAVYGGHQRRTLLVIPHDPDDDLADLRAKHHVVPLYDLAAFAAGRVPGVRVVGDGEVVVSREDLREVKLGPELCSVETLRRLRAALGERA